MLGELIPWANGQAVIAAKDSIAHRAGNAVWDGVFAFVFNIPVCNAFAGVELIGDFDGVGWAYIDTSGAGATLICMWGRCVRGKGQAKVHDA